MIKRNFVLFFLASLPALFVCFLSYFNFPLVGITYDSKFIQAAEQILESGSYSDNFFTKLLITASSL